MSSAVTLHEWQYIERVHAALPALHCRPRRDDVRFRMVGNITCTGPAASLATRAAEVGARAELLR